MTVCVARLLLKNYGFAGLDVELGTRGYLDLRNNRITVPIPCMGFIIRYETLHGFKHDWIELTKLTRIEKIVYGLEDA